MLTGFGSSTAFGQTFEQQRDKILQDQTRTRAEINVLDARIRSYQQRVQEAEQEFERSYKQFENINSLIALQDEKLRALRLEQNQIQDEINLTASEIDKREADLKSLIENYKKILLYAYKNGRFTDLELLLTSKSLNQMVVRAYYLQKFDEQKEKQANQIKNAKADLDDVKSSLESSLLKNEVVLDEIEDEKTELGNQKVEQERTVDEIRKQRSNWLAELQKSREERERFENNLADLIEEDERLRIAASRMGAASANTAAVSDAQLAAFTTSFASSKGILEWPVKNKTVSKKFGRTRNPVYGTFTDHPGINILVEPNAEVRVVADGVVFAIQPTPGYGDVIYVRHGSFYTAYGNLSQYTVRQSQVVKKGDLIGRSGNSSSELGENLFFLIRSGSQNVDPLTWLKK